jgi:polyisoprenoid-binding protein YceI
MKKTIFLLACIAAAGSLFAQKKTTTSAIVSFDATTPKDDGPKAENKTVIGSIDTQTGEVAFEVPVKNFSFQSVKMQEHFNGANWMNSDQFPKFTFTGKIDNLKKVKFSKDGTYKVKVTGDLTIKGISKRTMVEGTIVVTSGKIKVAANFTIKLADYNITGQPIEGGKVSKEPKISVTAEF